MADKPLDLTTLQSKIGEHVALHEIRKNRKLRKKFDVVSDVIITSIKNIYGTKVKIVSIRSTERGESNEVKSLYFDPDTLIAKGMNDVLNSDFIFTNL